MAPGASLAALGTGTIVRATAARRRFGRRAESPAAEAGAQLRLTQATSYTNTSTANSQNRQLTAVGAGSVLDLHNNLTITNGQNYQTNLAILAAFARAAVVSLSGGTTQIVDPTTTGDTTHIGRSGSPPGGTGSTITLSALTSFVDNDGGSTTGGQNRSSLLGAYNGGTVLDGALGTMTGVAVTLDGSGTLATSAWTTLNTVNLFLTGSAAYSFGSLTSATASVLVVNGVTTAFANLADIDGSSLLVDGGVTLSLPAVLNETNVSNANDEYRRCCVLPPRASSVLDLHNVQTITNGQNYDTNLTIAAVAGGAINLSGTTLILDPDAGDQRLRAIDVEAARTREHRQPHNADQLRGQQRRRRHRRQRPESLDTFSTPSTVAPCSTAT